MNYFNFNLILLFFALLSTSKRPATIKMTIEQHPGRHADRYNQTSAVVSAVLSSNNTDFYFFAPKWFQRLIWPKLRSKSSPPPSRPPRTRISRLIFWRSPTDWLTDAANKSAGCGCRCTVEWRRSRTRCVCLTYWGLRCWEAWAAVLGPAPHSVTRHGRRSPAEPRPVVCAESETSVDN